MRELLKLSFSRKGRLWATTLGPPILGGLAHAVILLVLLFFTEEAPIIEKTIVAVPLVLLSVIWAFVFVGVQSLVAGMLMEYVVRGLATRKFHIVVSAVFMGLLASATHRMDSPFVTFLGLLIGACLGLFLSYSFQTGQSGKESE